MKTLPPIPTCKAFQRRAGVGPYVIAEIGVNHEGDLDLAKRLIDEARNGGADCVKFQTYKAGKIASKNSPSYWDLNSEGTTSQYALFQKYDGFDAPEYELLARYAAEKGVDFSSTPFDLEAVEFLAPHLPFFKIASADLTNGPLLDACAKHKKPMILSTGAAHLSEVEEAVRRLQKTHDVAAIGLLHCVLSYPTDYENANLAAIEHLARVFPDHPIGYSDHTRPDPGMWVLSRSYQLGAVIIEKHFTHDKSLPGNDHYHAMDEADLRRFRQGTQLLHQVEGDGRKRVLEVEELPRKNARRSLVAVRALQAGHVLKAEDLIVKRPAFGLAPNALEWVIGKRLTKDLAEDDFLTYEHVTSS
jgi:sialic acid synthase SpsE